jgi:aminopeptidase YwaD
MMKYLLFISVFICNLTVAQSDKSILKSVKKFVYFLADDKLEGRRTGTAGESIAAHFIGKSFIDIGLEPVFNSNESYGKMYTQIFEVNEGIMYKSNRIEFNNKEKFESGIDYFPLPYSKNGTETIGSINNDVAFFDLSKLIQDSIGNPHYDFDEELYKNLKQAIESKHPKAIFIYNGNDTGITIAFDHKNKRESLGVLLMVCKKSVIEEIKKSSNLQNQLLVEIEIAPKIKTGFNVGGFINNGAKNTIILGAHYDHLGYGEDKNSLYVGSTPMIHNGADDNASGTAALIALAKIIKKKGNKKYNYLFAAFSGEELGLYGSKYFVEHCPVNLNSVNYMLNMDMVGRLNDSTHGLTIGGYGTSLVWGKIIDNNDTYFKIKIDSAGSGPSDHTSFYRKDIPVLFFFTGTHSDYHKPSDDADKINFEGEVKIIRYIESLIDKTVGLDKIPFLKTREAASMGKSSFKVTMGIMPDYTFSGNGVLVDGVSDNRPAQKAGIKTGDVITQLGEFVVSDVQTYMQALNKHSKGETINVKIIRGNEEISLSLTF